MNKKPNQPSSSGGQFLVYQAEDGKLKIDVRFHDETVWLSLNQLTELFQRDKSAISRHIKNVFDEGELIRSVKIGIATRFRIWATQRLREYIV